MKYFFVFCLFGFAALRGAEPDYKKQMVDSIREGKLSQVQSLIQSSQVGMEEPITEYLNNTPLLEAARNGRTAIMKYLIEAGADIYAVNSYKGTLLYELIHCSSLSEKKGVEMVRYLISLGVDVEDCVDSRRTTPLLAAAEEGKTAVMDCLLDLGADLFASNTARGTVLSAFLGRTDVSEKKAIEMVHRLIGLGADINLPGYSGATPLINACKGKRIGLVKELIQLGADPHARTQDGITPFIEAAIEGNVEVMKVLVDLGVDIDIVESHGRNALLSCIKEGKTKAFDYLAKDLHVDINQQDLFGATPLMWAAFYHQSVLVQKLIALSAEINARTIVPIQVNVSTSMFSQWNPVYETLAAGSTALTFAKRYGTPSVVQILERAGALE